MTDFYLHLEECDQCQQHPEELCSTGLTILRLWMRLAERYFICQKNQIKVAR